MSLYDGEVMCMYKHITLCALHVAGSNSSVPG